MLVQRAHALSDENWGLVECHPQLALGESGCGGLSGSGGNASHLGLGAWLLWEAWLASTDPCFLPVTPERGLEDHESVVEVQAAWPIGGDSRFVFRKNFAKYELFKSTSVSVCEVGSRHWDTLILSVDPQSLTPDSFLPQHSLFPEKMVSSCLDAHTGLSHEDLIQNFLNAGSFPEIQGFLQLRGSGHKLWKRFFCFLRRSGLYYSTKGTSKLNKLRNGHKALRVFCSEDEQSRTCWLAAFRLFKGQKQSPALGNPGLGVGVPQPSPQHLLDLRFFLPPPPQYGVQLYRNYQLAQSRHLHPSGVGSPPLRSVLDNTLVAMDFSGRAGRVIENPREALSAALEEAQAWRKKTNHRLSLPTLASGMSLSAGVGAAVASLSTSGAAEGGSYEGLLPGVTAHLPPPTPAIHRTQPWFHGRISREESQRLIGQQGLVDGLFLVRESQRNPQGFVLSLCHLQKVKHYLILPVSSPLPPQGSQILEVETQTHQAPSRSPPGPHCVWVSCSLLSAHMSNGDLSAGPKGSSSSFVPLADLPLMAVPQSEEEGRLYFSMDDGHTRFTDLLQLVEFHQLNRGILPCLLRHCCTRVAL
ncbi:hypothetical protein MC885_009682 [Smutsia gigantea]|nr:hypothetical protein MC885_009682 [Smutsia gigantea]